MKNPVFIYLIFLFLFASVLNCTGLSDSEQSLVQSLTFFASFDHGHHADFSAGDSSLYIAPSWSRRAEAVPFDVQATHFQILKAEGRYGNALWIDNSYTPVYFYKGNNNFFYSNSEWEGTVSFWLRLTPDDDLHDGFSDPIQLTTRAWNDGALFVDFTDESPRIFRFAFFPDREIWDPEFREWDDVPIEERPMIDLTGNIFTRDEWVHVAFTFRNFNTGKANGSVRGYINGEFAGSLDNREQTYTWEPDEIAIWLGYNYRGFFDELAIFDRALSTEEIRILYLLNHGVGGLLEK